MARFFGDGASLFRIRLDAAAKDVVASHDLPFPVADPPYVGGSASDHASESVGKGIEKKKHGSKQAVLD